MNMQNNVSNYGWTDVDGCLSSNYITPHLLKLITELQPNKVLDLGCGNGHLCNEINLQGFNIVGMDNDENGIKLAKEAFPNINFYHNGVQDDPQCLVESENNEFFDLVISTEVIEHLFSPQQLPQYAHNVLRPNGKMILTTPHHGYLKNLVLSLFNKWDHHHTALWEGGHIKFWSYKTITQLLNENGFEVINYGGVGRLPFLWKSMVITAIKK